MFKKSNLFVFVLLFAWSFAFAAGLEDVPDLELGWTIPTTRVDGTAMPLSEISHYNLYNGSEVVRVERDVTSYVLVDAREGTYSFYISTVDADGQEGPPSDPVAVTIERTPKARPQRIDLNKGVTCAPRCLYRETK